MRILTSPQPDEIRDLFERREFFWLDLDAPADDTLDEIGQTLRLHALALEDTREFGQRPKVDLYDDQLLLVYYGASRDEPATPTGIEVHLHVSDHYLLSVHRRRCDAFHAMQERLIRTPPETEYDVVYRVIDALSDSVLEVTEHVAEHVADHATEVFRHPRAATRDEMAALRRSLESFRRLLLAQRQVFERLTERAGELPGFTPDLISYYRDIADHLWQAVDETEAARDSIQNLLETYSNEVQERLTILATIFLPLTLISSFFGQNFNWMIDHIGSAGAFWGLGVGGTAVSLVAIIVWLIRSGLYNRAGRR